MKERRSEFKAVRVSRQKKKKKKRRACEIRNGIAAKVAAEF